MTHRALPALLLLAPALTAQGAKGQGQEMLRRFFLERLQDRVGLNDAQARQVADRWQRFQAEHAERQQEINHLRRRFQDILLSPDSEDQKNGRIKPLLDQFRDLRRRQQEAKQRFEDDILAGLTPAQQARLVVTVEEILAQLAKAVENRPALREFRKDLRDSEEGRPRRFNR